MRVASGGPRAAGGPAALAHRSAAPILAPHSFFDRKFEEFADASEDAWRRVLTFVEQHSSPTR